MSAIYLTRIAADHPCLAGHFPGNPIVPAVVILDCVQDALRAQAGAVRITRIVSVKFLAPLKPEEELRITLELAACRAWVIASEKAVVRGQILSALPSHSGSMGQKDGEIWTAQTLLQPIIPKPDRLLEAQTARFKCESGSRLLAQGSLEFAAET